MKKFKLYTSYSFITLIFTSLHAVYGSDGISQSIEQEDKEKFSLRENMINESIDQYKVLISEKDAYNYKDLFWSCKNLFPLYKVRAEFNREKNIEDKTCEEIYTSVLMKKVPNQELVHLYTGLGPNTRITPTESREMKNLASLVKKDILESLEMYEKLYTSPHPRKNEMS